MAAGRLRGGEYKWQDILGRYAGFAGGKGKSFFLKAPDVTLKNALLKEENMHPASMDRARANFLIMAYS